MTLEEALQDVDIAFRQFEFALKLSAYCESDRVDPEEFDSNHFVNFEHGSLHFPPGKFSNKESLIKASETFILLAFSATTFALDQAFETAGIKSDITSNDNTLRLRALVYMVRCAHAHRIAEPRWLVKGQYAHKFIVELNGVNLSIDLTNANGKICDLGEIGGPLNWFRIYEASKNILGA